jgi:osmotically-inducible protein OsmY
MSMNTNMSNQPSNLKSHPVPDDETVRENIVRELSGPHLWDTTDIRADVTHGVVTLTGTVADKEAWHKSAALVATIEGVTYVNNFLEIKGGGIISALSELAAEVSKASSDTQDDHKPA